MDGGIALRIARFAVDAPGERVVEVGPGTGALTAALLKLGAEVTAIDVDPVMVQILRSRVDLAAVHSEEADALTLNLTELAPPPRAI